MKIFGVVGWKNAGKTGLMERLITEITSRGFSVSSIKHAHHNFDLDHPGKDSHRHREAGAKQVLLASHRRWVLMDELRGAPEPDLPAQLARMDPVDLVLIEGFKSEAHQKIEARRALGHKGPLIAETDPGVRAIASDTPMAFGKLPVFDLDDTGAIADFVLQSVGLVDRPAEKPKLANDCFALPPGVSWTPVPEALETLRARMAPVVTSEILPIDQGLGRVLAADVRAARDNPPAANSAMDGYGLAGDISGDIWPLVAGRAAAGAPYDGVVPAGHAVRILTGAIVPAGVDRVVMQEDVAVAEDHIQVKGHLKPGANIRPAGEDTAKGAIAQPQGRRIGAAEIAHLTGVGATEAAFFAPLRVAVLSTGDELATPGETTDAARTYDANRPMLLGLARQWGYVPVDLGQFADDRDLLAAGLDRAAAASDVIFTSGGASAGDEDHVSALLTERGNLHHWRIAMKPGRPLALAMWNGVPVFGLPGNPVAAFVCALMFARPALAALSGQGWSSPQGFELPAEFTKNKKPGRHEYLRARIAATGGVEVFHSEGSGLVSGLSWATGLVELPAEAAEIVPGDPVRFIPFNSFGL